MDYIKVYRFHNAPQELKDLSTNDVDEDCAKEIIETLTEKE